MAQESRLIKFCFFWKNDLSTPHSHLTYIKAEIDYNGAA